VAQGQLVRTHHRDGPPLSPTFEHYARRVMSGEQRGPRAAVLRAAMSAASIPYALATAARGGLFNAGLRKPARLPRPVISVGNITTGGTGKTPVVRWLAEKLRQSSTTVAVLSRGYKAIPGELGDEQQMLEELLNRPGEQPVIVRANPSRLRAGKDVLQNHPGVGVFVLDDGFQHRQLARDFDLVLINAAEPFGFGHLLPRGMLREPLAGGLRRAHAFLLTRADHVDDAGRARIVETIRKHNASAPIYESVHAPTGFREPGRSDLLPLDALRSRRWFAFCGIGGPENFVRQLQKIGGTCVGHHGFADHHPYTSQDLETLSHKAASEGANLLVTTEKDWVKIAALRTSLPVWRLDVEIRFPRKGDEANLLADVKRAIDSAGVR
jgi:tetraacyldisaccharide 4'-kinase